MYIENLIKSIFNVNQISCILILLCIQFLSSHGVKFFDQDCYLYNNNDKYDLLRPSSEIWQKIDLPTDQLGTVSIDFSICRGKNQDRCSGISDLCFTNRNTSKIDHFADLNEVIFLEEILEFKFSSNKNSCKDKTLNTTIRMICSTYNHSPYFLEDSKDPCDLKINWIDKKACPIKEEISNKCFISSELGMYDLRPLNNDLITNMHNDKKIHLNVCGSVDNCPTDVSVAFINKSRCEGIASNISKKLILSSSRGLFMTFNQTHSNNLILIKFKCVDKIEPTLIFSDENEGNLYFILETNLACPRQKLKCRWEFENKIIDLSPLRNIDNYIVQNNKETLIFNICSSLNYKPGFLCSGVTSACLKKSDGHFINYGSDFNILYEKQFTISLIGEKCENRNYTLNITFIPTNIQQYPKILKQTSCSILLEWSTPYAIPIDYFKGSNCEINTKTTDTIRSHYQIQDFKKLFQIKDYRIDMHNGSFRINLCSHLREKCGQVSSDVSVCWTDEIGLDHPIGLTNEPYLRDGSFEFKLHGLSCSEDFLYSEVHFQMRCTYGKEELQFLNKIGCKFTFQWKTKEACFYIEDRNQICHITNGDDFYDLSPLISYTDNYHIDLTNNSKLLINICQPLIPQQPLYDSKCPLLSEACLINTTTTILNSKNIGSNSHLEIINKNHLRLKYDNAFFCLFGDRMTFIDFFCSVKESGPQLVEQHDNCFYHLEWNTTHACSKSKSTSLPCYVSDPNSDKIVNLTSLMHNNPYEIDGYYVSICTPIRNSFCNGNASVCSISSKTSHGDFTNKISILDNSVLLNYTTSDCTTLIYFICAEKETIPDKIHKINCTIIMYWYTPHACINKPIKCTFADSNMHKIYVGNGTVLLKACSMLEPDFEECPGGSSSCLILNNSSLSIGYPLSEPSYQDDGSVILATKGDFCDLNGIRYSTIIHFVCNSSESNESPYFQKLHDCKYHFVWPTASLCKKIKPIHKCDQISSNIRKKLNEQLYMHEIHEIVVKDELYISLCDSKPICESDVCFKRKNTWFHFGGLAFDNIVVAKNKTTIMYKTDQISDISCFGRVVVNCQTTTGKGSPQITWMKPDCGFEVVWNTSLICESPQILILESSSSWSWSFFIFLTIMSVFGGLVYLKRKNNFEFFRRIFRRPLTNEENASMNLFHSRIEINEYNDNLRRDQSLTSLDERWSWDV